MRLRYWVWLIPWIGFGGECFAGLVEAAVASRSETTANSGRPSASRRMPFRFVGRLTGSQASDPGDWLIAVRIRAALWKDSDLSSESVEVIVRQGVAILHGPVPTEELRQKAVELARKTSGVKEVRDLLRVRAARPPPTVRPVPFPPVDAPPRTEEREVPAVPRPRTDPSATTLTTQPRIRGPSDGQLLEWKPGAKSANQTESSGNLIQNRGAKPAESDWRPLDVQKNRPTQPKPTNTRLLDPIVERN